MNTGELCINCFKPTGGEEVCMHCGTVQKYRPKQLCHLFPHTVLRDRYIIGDVINNGGFGVVYKAYDTKLKNIVAIKEFLPTQNSMVTREPGSTNVILIEEKNAAEFEQMKNSFIQEARTMAKFAHCESIVRIYEFFEENCTAYFVMEYLDGISLREFLATNEGSMSYENAMSIMLPVMEALKALHKEKIIHCDVCPDNIFLCVNNHTKLLDFGEAKYCPDNKEIRNSLVTKPGYTPPEQYKAKSKIGTYTDTYAVAAVLYFILTGKVPVESIDRAEKDTLQRLSKLGVDVPVYTDKSIMKAMALREENRFKSIDDFINALQGKKKAEFPEVEIRKKKIRRNISIVAIFVLMFVSVVGALLFNSLNSLVPSKDATLEIWYVKNADEEVNGRWDKLEEEYNKFLKKENNLFNAEVKIEIKGIEPENYKQELEKAFEEGNGPDIYDASMLSEDENAESLKSLYKELKNADFDNSEDEKSDSKKKSEKDEEKDEETTEEATEEANDETTENEEQNKEETDEDSTEETEKEEEDSEKQDKKENDKETATSPFEYMRELYEDKNQIAFCYDMPVLYVSTVLSDTTPDTDAELTQLIDYVDEEYSFKYSLVTNPEAVLYAGYCYGYDGENNQDTVQTLYDSSRNFDAEKNWLDPSYLLLKMITDEDGESKVDSEAKYYIGLVSEYRKLYNEAGNGVVSMMSLTGENTEDCYLFPEVWSVNKNSDSNEKKAAIFLLYFLINNADGQKTVSRVRNSTYYLPLLSKEFDTIAKNRSYEAVINSSKDYVGINSDEVYDINNKSEKIVKSAKAYENEEAVLDNILK